MSKMRVLGAGLSPPTTAVRWTLHLVNVKDVAFEVLDANNGDHVTDEFLRTKNPNGKYPVLVDGDFVMHESNAIARYIVNKYADETTRERLYPLSNLQTRARVDQWLDWKDTLRSGVGGLTRRRVLIKLLKDPSKHSMRFDVKELPEERLERTLMGALRIMEGQLAATSFIAGTQEASLADIMLFAEINNINLLPEDLAPPKGSKLDADFPHIAKWMDVMRQLDGYETMFTKFAAVKETVKGMREAGTL